MVTRSSLSLCLMMSLTRASLDHFRRGKMPPNTCRSECAGTFRLQPEVFCGASRGVDVTPKTSGHDAHTTGRAEMLQSGHSDCVDEHGGQAASSAIHL